MLYALQTAAGWVLEAQMNKFRELFPNKVSYLSFEPDDYTFDMLREFASNVQMNSLRLQQ